jgi:hypothetical protein
LKKLTKTLEVVLGFHIGLKRGRDRKRGVRAESELGNGSHVRRNVRLEPFGIELWMAVLGERRGVVVKVVIRE